MERMSEHTGLISSYQLLITAACTNTGGKMKCSHPRTADRCPFVHRHIKVRLPLSCSWECYEICPMSILHTKLICLDIMIVFPTALRKLFFAMKRHIAYFTNFQKFLLSMIQLPSLLYCPMESLASLELWSAAKKCLWLKQDAPLTLALRFIQNQVMLWMNVLLE